MFRIQIILMPFLLLACATHEDVRRYKVEKQYSKGVEDSLKMIESEEYQHQQSREAALERYRRMRLSDKETRPTRRYRKRKRVHSIKYSAPQETRYKATPVPQKPKKRVIHTDPEEMAIEIEQKLTYYCMQKRKSSRFREQGSCQEFTNNTLNDCQSEFDIDDKNLLYCVEKKIR